MVFDVVCFSHLRWQFVFQRPQHLLSRFARNRRVFFVEEPVYGGSSTYLDISVDSATAVNIVVPRLPQNLFKTEEHQILKTLLNDLIQEHQINQFISWYYAPMMFPWTKHLSPRLVVYDCMDELSAFRFAPPELVQNEADLIERADIMFTGGHSLYEAKKHRHSLIFPFPSSIDRSHFAQAREEMEEPTDQASILHPRLGFYGVLDERFDIELLRKAAALRPGWHFVMIGPIVKIAEEDLPKAENIHYLGGKSYNDLPQYLSGWDIALLPFAINESTKFISPTKTPEYLAGGKPVISTSIKDVCDPYGEEGLVEIINDAEELVSVADVMLHQPTDPVWLHKVDSFLEVMSWDRTWNEMLQLIRETIQKNEKNNQEDKLHV